MEEGEEPRGGGRTRSEERTNAPATGAIPRSRASFRGGSLVFGEGDRSQGRTTRATVALHEDLRTVGSRTIHATEVQWRRNVDVDDDDGGSRGFRGFVFFVCNGDDVLETVSVLSFSCFLSFLVVFVVSFVCTVDDLASVGLGRKHDESSTRFGHHHSIRRYSKRWRTKIEFDWTSYDEVEVHLVGRRHLPHLPTKAGPGGTSSRYFEGCERDKRNMPTLLSMPSKHTSNISVYIERDVL